MMERTVDDALRWTEQGTKVLLDLVDQLAGTDYLTAIGLPGWTRQHLLAHVAANADALGNLVRWAATGDETPMYATPEARTAGIAHGLRLAPDDLDGWVKRSAGELTRSMNSLNAGQWERLVRTAQGRAVPATEIPWLRAREVCVHAVDLDRGVTFADLPKDFLAALRVDILAKRGITKAPAGPLDQVTAYLAGRRHTLSNAPKLGPWL